MLNSDKLVNHISFSSFFPSLVIILEMEECFSSLSVCNVVQVWACSFPCEFYSLLDLNFPILLQCSLYFLLEKASICRFTAQVVQQPKLTSSKVRRQFRICHAGAGFHGFWYFSTAFLGHKPGTAWEVEPQV